MRKLGGRGTVRVLLCVLNRDSGLYSAGYIFLSVLPTVFIRVLDARAPPKNSAQNRENGESRQKSIRRARRDGTPGWQHRASRDFDREQDKTTPPCARNLRDVTARRPPNVPGLYKQSMRPVLGNYRRLGFW
jgi:hypothetical protein